MIKLGVALAVMVAIGLLWRLAPIGWPPYDKSLGDVLYAIAAYLVLAMLLFRWPRYLAAGLAFSMCLAVEFFQATGIPERHADWFIVRWLIGTDFAWHDVGCYFLGIAVIWQFDVWLLKTRPPSPKSLENANWTAGFPRPTTRPVARSRNSRTGNP